jgi:hypothetical protein
LNESSVMERVRDLRRHAEEARERAAFAGMTEDKASWLRLASQWNQLANVEAASTARGLNDADEARPLPNFDGPLLR